MNDDPNEHMAPIYPGLVSDLQRADVEAFEAAMQLDRQKRAELRHGTPNAGLNASELLAAMGDADPDQKQAVLDAEIAKIQAEAAAVVAATDQSTEELPAGFFPPPPIGK